MKMKVLSILFIPLLLNINIYGDVVFRIVELNTENTFDCYHDEGKNDNEFLPNSPRRWTKNRYYKKITGLCQEIVAIHNNSIPPDIIALTEIENDSVINDIIHHSILNRLDYKYVMTNSEDKRGIDVAMMYQEARFKLLSHHNYKVKYNKHYTKSRDILYASGKLINGDTIHIIVCHLSSKLGGKTAKDNRAQQLLTIKTVKDSICKTTINPKIIITGDFNDVALSRNMSKTLGTKLLDNSISEFDNSALYDMAHNAKGINGSLGNYKYEGEWSTIDHIIVTGNLLNKKCSSHSIYRCQKIFDENFLLEEDYKYIGKKPFRTYNGMKYNGGFSDHLPIYCDFILRQ